MENWLVGTWKEGGGGDRRKVCVSIKGQHKESSGNGSILYLDSISVIFWL